MITLRWLHNLDTLRFGVLVGRSQLVSDGFPAIERIEFKFIFIFISIGAS